MQECDASALLRYDSRQFIPLAIDGLAKDVLGRRFALAGHPRLEAIARAGDVVRFPADSELPDPYDGLIPGQESLKVLACVGLPLFAGQNLIGALTLDGMQPDQFDVFSDEELRLIAALAAGALMRWFAVVCRAKPDRCLDARRDAARSVRCFQRRRATADCRTGGGSVKQGIAD